MTAANVVTIVGLIGSMLAIATIIFGRLLKRFEDRADVRDEAIAVMVQHFDPNSELTKNLKGTLPDRVLAIINKLDDHSNVAYQVDHLIERVDGHGVRLTSLEQSQPSIR